jgi:hypothetical protein
VRFFFFERALLPRRFVAAGCFAFLSLPLRMRPLRTDCAAVRDEDVAAAERKLLLRRDVVDRRRRGVVVAALP